MCGPLHSNAGFTSPAPGDDDAGVCHDQRDAPMAHGLGEGESRSAAFGRAAHPGRDWVAGTFATFSLSNCLQLSGVASGRRSAADETLA